MEVTGYILYQLDWFADSKDDKPTGHKPQAIIDAAQARQLEHGYLPENTGPYEDWRLAYVTSGDAAQITKDIGNGAVRLRPDQASAVLSRAQRLSPDVAGLKVDESGRIAGWPEDDLTAPVETFADGGGLVEVMRSFTIRAELAGVLDPEDQETPVSAPTSLVTVQPVQPVRLWPLYALAALNSLWLAVGTVAAAIHWWAPLLAFFGV